MNDTVLINSGVHVLTLGTANDNQVIVILHARVIATSMAFG